MTPVVVDASAVVEILLQGAGAHAAQRVVGDDAMLAPDLVDAEVLSTLRKHESADELEPARAVEAVEDLADMPIERVTTVGLILDVWELRHNLTPYDAAYVTLARALDCPLLTHDHRLARAPGLGVAIVAV